MLSFVYNNLKIEGMGYCTVNLGGGNFKSVRRYLA